MTAKKKNTAAVAAKQVKSEAEAPAAPAISAAPVEEDTGSAETLAAAVPEGSNAPANLPDAVEFAPSGAPVQVVPDVEPSHPAVDANPRANTTDTQNRIDFNDPTISGQEAVERNLGLK